MRTERVVTNLTCNQNCTWCTQRSARDVPAFVAGAAVGARIDAALATGAEEIVLTGGEPSLRRDLAALNTRAARGGGASAAPGIAGSRTGRPSTAPSSRASPA